MFGLYLWFSGRMEWGRCVWFVGYFSFMVFGFVCDEMEVVSILYIELVEIVLFIVNIIVMGVKSIRENGIIIYYFLEKRVLLLVNKFFFLGLDCYYYKIIVKIFLFLISMIFVLIFIRVIKLLWFRI